MTSRTIVLALVASCTRTPTPPQPTTPPATATATTPDAAPTLATDASAAPVSLCDRALATHRAAIAGLPPDAEQYREALGSFGRCLETPRGAWVIGLASAQWVAQPEQQPFVRGRWAVAHVLRDGAAAQGPGHDDEWITHSRAELATAALFDYDGDGEPELVLAVHTNAHESADGWSGEVLTFRDGAIAPYAPAAEIKPEQARDVDGDGRLDLLTRAPYEGNGDDSPSDFTYLMQGPLLLAHSLPDGTFSRDDEVAKRVAREACPARVAAVFPRSAPGSTELAPVAVVCARLWGLAPAAVTRAVTTRCASPEEYGGGSPRRPHCGDTRVLRRWIDARPPLTLP